MCKEMTVVLVHGWSVLNTNTYGGLAERLKAEAAARENLAIDVTNIWLSKYVSFNDEVRMEDLARGLEAAIQRELADKLKAKQPIAFITHSTGGPVVRDWWERYYRSQDKPCPMSHLIMLAPANFGSALAQLGKQTLGRLKAWFNDVEPGQKVLDWLELGSPEAWELNRKWIDRAHSPAQDKAPIFPFVLTGQTIDRKLYDAVNSYTGELGSDGVVRVPAANLNATYIRLKQDDSAHANKAKSAPLKLSETASSPPTAFAIIEGRSHSGKSKGILRSIKSNAGQSDPTVRTILECLQIDNNDAYSMLCDTFEERNEQVMADERIEHKPGWLVDDYIHDKTAMLILRVRDDKGHDVTDFDLVFTGKGGKSDGLPTGFFLDRQRNSRVGNTLTYFLNQEVLMGCAEARETKSNDLIRKARRAVPEIGLEIIPRPGKGYIRYVKATLSATQENLKLFLKPNQTILVDIVLQRVVGRGIFEMTQTTASKNFKKQPAGDPI